MEDHVQCDLYIKSIGALFEIFTRQVLQHENAKFEYTRSSKNLDDDNIQRFTLMTMAKAVATTSALGDVWFIGAVQ